MTLPVVFTANGASTYNLTKSLRFRSSASAYLNRTPASAGSSTKMTFSFWTKRGQLSKAFQNLFTSGASAGNGDATIFTSGDAFRFWLNGGSASDITTSQVFRDPSAWYHIVIAIDTTQATASNRVLIYVNGTQVTAFASASYPNQNYAVQYFNTTTQQQIGYGVTTGNGGNYYDGYMTEINFVDGQQLTPSSFGSTNATTGVWQPAKYTSTYGTNGFYLPFTNTTSTTTLGYDFSGNSNNWTTNNLSLTAGTTYDSMTDVPTLTSATTANYAVLNPLQTNNSGALTYSNANLTAAHGSGTSSSGGVYKALSSMASSSGKFYAEFVLNSFYSNGAAGADMAVGVTSDLNAGNLLVSPVGYSYYADGGSKFNNGSGSAYGSSWTSGDVIGIALDVTNGKVWFAKNNTWQAGGDPAAGTNAAFTGLSGAFAFAFANSTGSSAFVQNFTINFGQQPFTYTPPTGFVGMNTYNLPTSTIVKGNTVMDVSLYTGNAVSVTVTNTAGFKPDLVWGKSRSNAINNSLVDSNRGVSKSLFSNLTDVEDSAAGFYITGFNSNGFTVGLGTTLNTLNATYVGWQWQAGQGTNTSNTSGSITSTVSVNASAGFSIVTWTDSASTYTVGHGLGVAPQFIILKDRSNAYNWDVGCNAIGWTKRLKLNDTSATSTGYWNSTAPTSSVFSYVGNGTGSMVAYCWTPIAGFSAFGSYTGNGSTDGPFIYTGFRPKFVLFKQTDTAGSNWRIFDSVRDTYNAEGYVLFPSLSDAEPAYTAAMDFVANGVKIRNTSGGYNTSGGTYIYMAFAENPFKNALAR